MLEAHERICGTGRGLFPKAVGKEAKVTKKEFVIMSSPEFIEVEK